MKQNFRIFTVSVLSLCLASFSTKAQVKLPYFFSDNMVLQQQTKVNIWGWDKAGKTIKVSGSWARQTVTAVTDKDGKWQLQLPTVTAGGPYTLTISDGTPVILHNVLLGEVWLCSGQSNMEMPVKGFKNTPVLESGETILNSQNKNIRLFNVPRSTQLAAQDTCKANHWNEASPEVVCNFSATGYFFGKLLNQFLNIPVGLICSSYGGSPVEAFMSKETLTPFKKDIRIPDENARVNNRTSTAIFNGMIHPIIGYSIKGCIWYQGESNYDKPDLYKQLFPAMVKEWRTEWDIGEFPFYFVQIAPFDYAQLPPYNSGGKYNSAYIRDAQRKCLSLIPNSGMAVIMDLGEEQNIHPRHKQEVGKRLALLALGNTYGRKGFEYASPLYDSLHMEGSTVTVHFKNTPNGLTSFGKEISTFEIAGNDKVFHAAKAVIINSGVILSSPEVKQPVAVRYAFKDFVVGDLFSTEGLPVSSFSTEEGN